MWLPKELCDEFTYSKGLRKWNFIDQNVRDYYEWLQEREKVKLPKELIMTEEGDNLKSKPREVEINSSSKKKTPLCN